MPSKKKQGKRGYFFEYENGYHIFTPPPTASTLVFFILLSLHHAIIVEAQHTPIIDLSISRTFSGHIPNGPSSSHLFMFSHRRPGIDLTIRIEVDHGVDSLMLFLSFKENNTSPDATNHDALWSVSFERNALSKSKRFDLRSKDVYGSETTLRTKPAVRRSGVYIYMRVVIHNRLEGGSYYNLSWNYNLSIAEGLLLFVGYAFFTLCCFLLIPCMCLGCAFSISFAKRCCIHRRNQALQANPEQHIQPQTILRDTYEELLRIFQHLETQQCIHDGTIRVTKESINQITTRWNLRQEHFKEEKIMGKTCNHTCSICLEDYQTEEQVRILPCNHIFHEYCIDRWLFSSEVPKRNCPICKVAI